MDEVAVADHLAPVEADVSAGTYRVVGTAADRMTLLRVGDATGRRIHTGEVVTIDRADLDGFEPATDPDQSRSPRDRVAAVPTTAYWSVRAFLQQLRQRPVASGLAGVAFVLGVVGNPTLPVTPLVADVLVLVGGFGLAAIGSGRLG